MATTWHSRFGQVLALGSMLACGGVVWAAPAAPSGIAIPGVGDNAVHVRVKDIARVQTVRDNQLMGYGLVVGLDGTGDTSQSPFTAQALTNMLQRLGNTVPANKLKSKNIAAVLVTADIGPFLTSGDRLDITVSSVGDASSLQGGMLLQCPLMGANGKVYAVAQGAVSLGGYAAASGGASKTAGHPTVGRIPEGALVEAEIAMDIVEPGKTTITYALRQPDFTTAARMAAAINQAMPEAARARNAASVDIDLTHVPRQYDGRVVELIAAIGELTLEPDAIARVVINERTGTVVIGGQVKVTPVAIAQGNLTVTVTPEQEVSQPLPFSEGGNTVVTPKPDLQVEQPAPSLALLSGNTVDELVRALNALKVSPRDIIAILQAMKQAGALQAELQIM